MARPKKSTTVEQDVKATENATIATVSDSRLDKIERTVTLRGLTDIMFDRYPGDNSTKLDWSQKIYMVPGTNVLCMPATNLHSFLSAHNTNSAPKRLRDPRKFKKICDACLSFTIIQGPSAEYRAYIPFTRPNEEGEQEIITVGKFGDELEPQSGLYLDRRVARLDKGIPNPKERPVLPAPWELTFKLTILPNKEIKEQEIHNLFVEGGLAIGLGTYRGAYGKFEVARWE